MVQPTKDLGNVQELINQSIDGLDAELRKINKKVVILSTSIIG